MLVVLAYLIFGGSLSAYLAGRFIEPDHYGDYFAAWVFTVVSTVLWPIVIPVFFAMRAGQRRGK